MDDVLIVGGGVIGLSLAYELAGHGLSVRLLDRTEPGREASWAGAGILPPAADIADCHPYEQLAGLSRRLLIDWSAQLRDETGIDNGYRRCGAIHIARDAAAVEQLEQMAAYWQARGIAVERLESRDAAGLEPALADAAPPIEAACYLPDEAQLRNPRHLKALLVACRRRGVEIEAGQPVERFEARRGRIERVLTAGGARSAGAVCITGGAWSRSLLETLGLAVPLKPIRGQIVLLAGDAPPVERIVNEGPRYIVPRPDGRVLLGSTEEDAGFVKQTTSRGVDDLLGFGLGLAPSLGSLAVERCWAGLRPATPDAMPYLGRVPGIENAYVAAGHFRSGLSLSAGTARIMAQLIRGQEPQIDLMPFAADRFLLREEPVTIV